jgi:hypothetical protein
MKYIIEDDRVHQARGGEEALLRLVGYRRCTPVIGNQFRQQVYPAQRTVRRRRSGWTTGSVRSGCRQEAGVDDNTIFILSSDNAGGGVIPQTGPGSNGPWRGDFFHTPFEEHAVPAMIRWRYNPGRCRHGTDACCCGLAGRWPGWWNTSNLVPKDRPIDGVDASAFMLGKSDAIGRDTYMFFGNDSELMP